MTLGADLTLVDRANGNTALHWAAIQGNHTAVSILLKHGVSVEPVNKEVRFCVLYFLRCKYHCSSLVCSARLR